MNEYNHKTIEKKWQKYWEKNNFYQAEDFSKKEKFYCLIEFPYPSGEGLHVGHPRSYTGLDVLARMKRMQGFNVLYPIGWDAFGLPAENYAIKTGTHPKDTTEKNIATFKRQLKSFGYSFDWTREINTTDPKYYKWTQWIFLQLFKKGLAYKAEIPINFCTSCKVGLANEEVVNGVCERCGGEVIKKVKKQWMLKITAYADKLLEDLKTVDYQNRIKVQQENWIGKSYGLEEEWQVEGMDLKLKTFTTWAHTSWGATFMVIAPEHPIIDELVKKTKYEKEAKAFAQKVIEDKIKDPLNVDKVKEGFFIGRNVINHLNGRVMPLYIANFAIYDYGTGIVKCTPAHDQRDYEFAKKYKLEIIPVISPAGEPKLSAKSMKEAYTGEGVMINAEQFSDMPTKEARKAIGDYTVKQQRYWGEPIPIIECQKCGFVPLSEKDLPLILPEVEKYQTTKTGESPLANITEWVNVKCPKCKGDAKRETDTMPQWAGSSWYFLRYIDPDNDKTLADKKLLEYWAPIDWYNGGMEHTTLHLLYSRFWNKFLYDIEAIPNSEPYAKRTSHGLILGEGGEKMSKSKGNVINPDDVVSEFGADTFRVYEMFMGPFDQPIPWDTKGVIGVRRFLEKIWRMQEKISDTKNVNKNLQRVLHQTIKKVTSDIQTQDYNTAVSSLMILAKELSAQKEITRDDFKTFLFLLSPFAPHIAEELWANLGNKKSITIESWPEYDEDKAAVEEIELVIQINGKVRDKILVPANISEEEAVKLAKESKKVDKFIEGKSVKKEIFVPGKLINLVV